METQGGDRFQARFAESIEAALMIGVLCCIVRMVNREVVGCRSP